MRTMKETRMSRKTIQSVKSMLGCCVAVGLVYGVMFACGITCPIRFLTGISCPGCGMTRAWLSALRLDFAAAFAYHPLWVLLVPWAVAAWLSHRRGNKKLFEGLLIAASVLMVAAYAYRLCVGSEIVVFAPAEGWIVKCFRAVFKL